MTTTRTISDALLTASANAHDECARAFEAISKTTDDYERAEWMMGMAKRLVSLAAMMRGAMGEEHG